jgi:hypothetical protein
MVANNYRTPEWVLQSVFFLDLMNNLEMMINARFVWFLESNGLFSNIQCGLRQGR